MHVFSPLLVVAVIVLGVLNTVLTPGFAIISGAIFAVFLIFFSLTTIAVKFSGKKKIFNVTEALSTFLNSQFSLIFSMFCSFGAEIALHGKKSKMFER